MKGFYLRKVFENTGDSQEVVSVMGQVPDCLSALRCVCECGIAYVFAWILRTGGVDLC